MITWTPRFVPLAFAAVLACSGSVAEAAIQTFTGNTTGAPTFTRALEDFSGLSAAGTGVHYDTLTFSASVSGSYTFLTTATFDSFVFLYTAPFNPSTPLLRGIAANDDLLSSPLTTSGFAATLTAGTSYVYVTTGFATADFGAYSTTIGGPGVISAVPEPDAAMLLLAGLGAVAGLKLRSRRGRDQDAVVA